MTKHRFTFILKYVLLAAAICAVLCFAGVFARYTTSESEIASVSLSGFDVIGELYVVNGDAETLVSDSNIPTSKIVQKGDTISMKLIVTNHSDVSVYCKIEANEYFALSWKDSTISERTSEDNVLKSETIGCGSSASSNLEFIVSLADGKHPSEISDNIPFLTYPLELTVTYTQAE